MMILSTLLLLRVEPGEVNRIDSEVSATLKPAGLVHISFFHSLLRKFCMPGLRQLLFSRCCNTLVISRGSILELFIKACAFSSSLFSLSLQGLAILNRRAAVPFLALLNIVEFHFLHISLQMRHVFFFSDKSFLSFFAYLICAFNQFLLLFYFFT